jgi:hypothetical protein
MQQGLLIRKLGFTLSVIALCLMSCTSVRLISDYDEITDKAVTALQEKVSRFFVQLSDELGTEQAAYVNYKNFYRDVKVDLASIQIRANAIDKNDIVQQQLESLKKVLTDMEALHKIGIRNTQVLQTAEQACNRSFTAIIKLQLALKRGQK